MSRLHLPHGPTLHVPGRYAAPMAPQPIVDATEEWARKSGRHVRWAWSKEMECWTINLSMRADAPVMKAWREGRLDQAEPPSEGVPLIEQDPKTGKMKALDLDQYGPSGIVEMLEKADTWSGRGENDSLLEFVNKVIEGNRRNREKIRERQKEFVIDRAMDLRRIREKIPFLRVGKNIGGEAE